MPSVSELANQIQDFARDLGIQKFDLSGSTVDETSVQVDQGSAKQMKASNRSGVTVRVWNPQVGVTSTNDLTPDGLRLALATALEASLFGVKDHSPDFSPEATLPLPEIPQPRDTQVSAQVLLESLLKAEKSLLAAHPAIKGVPYNGLAQRDMNRFYVNSEGSLRQEGYSSCSVYLYARTEEEGKKPRAAGAMRLSYTLDQLDIPGCLEEAAEKTISHLAYEKIQTGKYPVVFSPEAFLSLLGSFSNLFNAQNILDNQSLSTPDSLGTAIASPLLSVYDDGLYPGFVGASAFDGEGTPTRRVELIQNGILTGFLHSAGTAKRMGSKPTGHANIGAKVTVGSNFYHVLPGTEARPDLSLDQANEVIFIDELQALHAGVKALQGSFSLPFDGWILRHGEKVSIESATVAGDFRELLKAIIHVDPVAQLTPGGVCPIIWVEGLSITGD